MGGPADCQVAGYNPGKVKLPVKLIAMLTRID